MFRVHTGSKPTDMIHFVTLRYFPEMGAVDEPMEHLDVVRPPFAEVPILVRLVSHANLTSFSKG